MPAAAFIEHAKAFADAGGVAEENFQAAGGLMFFFGFELLEKLFRRGLLLTGGGHGFIISNFRGGIESAPALMNPGQVPGISRSAASSFESRCRPGSVLERQKRRSSTFERPAGRDRFK